MNMKRIFALVIVCLPVGYVLAEPLNEAVKQPWTSERWAETMKTMPTGDPLRGKKLYKKAYCTSCHGEAGVPLTDGAPAIAGQVPVFIYKALRDYKSGLLHIDKKSYAMAGATAVLTKQDMVDLSAYLGSLKRPQKVSDPSTLPSQNLAMMCQGCHGVSGLGGKNYAGPALAGLNRFYLKRQLIAFQTGQRHNEINNMMFNIMGTWSQKQIDDLAEYYSSL